MMNGKICLDKRLGYLMLFAVPVLLMVVISAVINRNQITENSKASEIKPTVVAQATPAPTSMPTRGTCLIPRPGKTAGTIDLFMADYDGYKDDRLIKVYATEGRYFTLMTMDVSPVEPGQNPVAAINSNLLTGGTSYSFIALQGDDTNISMTGRWGQLSKNCTPFMVK